MNLIKFVSDRRGVSGSLFKLVLAAIIFAAVIALIVVVVKPVLEGQELSAIWEKSEEATEEVKDTVGGVDDSVSDLTEPP